MNVHHQILLSDSHIRDWARFKWGLFALVIKEKWTSDEMNDRSSWKHLRSGKEEIERSFVANIVQVDEAPWNWLTFGKRTTFFIKMEESFVLFILCLFSEVTVVI